jgi:hypothetical protein
MFVYHYYVINPVHLWLSPLQIRPYTTILFQILKNGSSPVDVNKIERASTVGMFTSPTGRLKLFWMSIH